MEIKLGKHVATAPIAASERFSGLLWGPSGCGKTTLAATMPRPILFIAFDNDAASALTSMDDDDIHVIDLSGAPDAIVEEFKEENKGMCRDLDKMLEDSPIKTVIVDSLTTFGDKALPHGVTKAKTTAKGRAATIEDPGFSGWGNKNTWTRLITKNLLSITRRHKKHVMFIAHEDKPEKDDKGIVMFITIMLGSSLSQQVPLTISEVWNMQDTGRKRTVAVRSVRGRRPMKSRMFTIKEPEFNWKYDADLPGKDKKNKGHRVSDWIDEWHKAGHKIALPK